MDAKQSLALYEEIFKGAQMGIESIDEIMRRTKDRQFRHELMRTQNDYKYIASEANENIQRLGGTPQELPALTRMRTWSMVGMAALVDNSPKGMSDMLLKGMDMADKGMHESAKKYPHAERAAHELADRLLELQVGQRSVYRKYLN